VQAHSVTVSLNLRPAAGALFRTRKPLPAGPLGAEAVFGRMRSNVGHWHLVDSRGATYELRAATWGECPLAFRLVGTKRGADGFWLCARRDLAANRFYVGNVVKGSVRYYRVQSGRVRRLRVARRFSCSGTSRLLGWFLSPDGFWLCLGPQRLR
jgi:hypothetical protein